MIRLTISSLFLFLAFASAGETRTWRNQKGTKSFEARFIEQKDDKVTLLRSDGKKITFETAMLHVDDQRWLNKEHPGVDGQMPDKHAVFDTLKFGDRREAVTAKLKASEMVETSVDGVFLGRTGLNGIYRTRQKIGGLYCYLFFNWSETGKLKEITLQTETKKAGDYTTVLQPCWEEMSELITPLHGKPIQKMRITKPEILKDGQMLATHLWKIDHGGTVMLGTSNTDGGYQVVVRFTKDVIEPIRTTN